MSASAKKKIRKEQNAASLTEKQQKELKEVKKLKAYTVTFIVVMVLIVAIIAGVALRTPVAGIIDRNTKAITIGTHTLSTTDLSYYYYETLNNFYQQFSDYGDYAVLYMQMYGLNPYVALDLQVIDQSTGETWADYFVDAAKQNARWAYAMRDAAEKDPTFALSAEDEATLTNLESSLNYYASYAGYSSVASYLRGIYGPGATLKNYTEYYRTTLIATTYANQYLEGLSFTSDDYRNYEKDKTHEFNSYSYAVYELISDDYLDFLGLGTTSTDEDGKETVTYTDAEKQQALAAALEDAKLLTAEGIVDVETFNAAINALLINQPTVDDKKETEETEETEGTEEAQDAETEETEDTEETEEAEEAPATTATVEATIGNHILYSSLSTKLNAEAQTWLSDSARKAGDVTYLEISTGEGDSKVVTGYYVVMYTGVDDNTYYSADVQHILIKFEGGKKDADGNTIYTQEEKDKAKAEAQAILDSFLQEERQDSEVFGLLAEENSEDTGSASEGGLISGVNWDAGYVEAFTQWATSEHEVGDTGLVETEYGWHIMFYTAKSELSYRDSMIDELLTSETYTAWEEGLTAALTITDHDLSGLETDFIFTTE